MHFDRPIYTFQLNTHTFIQSMSLHTHTHRGLRASSHVCANVHAYSLPFHTNDPSDVAGKYLLRIVLVIMFIRFCACVMTNMIALKTSLAVVCAPRLITLGLMKWEIKVHLATRSYLLIHVVQKLMSNALPSSALANLKAFQP